MNAILVFDNEALRLQPLDAGREGRPIPQYCVVCGCDRVAVEQAGESLQLEDPVCCEVVLEQNLRENACPEVTDELG